MNPSSYTLIGNVIGLIILVCVTVWVYHDAKMIGTDQGRAPGLVNTKPGAWAFGVFLLLIGVLPVYLLMRVRYKRLAVARRLQLGTLQAETQTEDTAGVWPPPPERPGL